MDKFQEVLLTRRCNDKTGWAAAELHCLVPGKSSLQVDKRESKIADKEEKDIAKSTKVSLMSPASFRVLVPDS